MKKIASVRIRNRGIDEIYNLDVYSGEFGLLVDDGDEIRKPYDFELEQIQYKMEKPYTEPFE